MYGSRIRAVRTCLIASLTVFVCLDPSRAMSTEAQEKPPLTLREAVDSAVRRHPLLAGYPLELRAAEGRVLQASSRPNPELSVEVENFGWDLHGTGLSETTVSVSQLLETGKRSSRIRKAEGEKAVVRRDFEIARLDVTAEVKRAFIGLLGAQERRSLTREANRIATLLADTVSERVAAGAVSPIEETRARVALAVSTADVERAEREVEAARRELAASMGETAPSFVAAAGDLDENIAVPAAETLSERLAATPDATRWDAERDRRSAALDAERSLRIPDVTLTGGIRHLRETSENTFVLGLSVPLPLFNRNGGAIREAEAQRARTDFERRAAEVRLNSRAAERRAAIAAAAREASLLRKEALTGAQSAYDAVNEGYRLGKFRYLDVLDAGQALIDTRLRYLDALVELNLAGADLERLLAKQDTPARELPVADKGDAR